MDMKDKEECKLPMDHVEPNDMAETPITSNDYNPPTVAVSLGEMHTGSNKTPEDCNAHAM